MFGLTNAAFAMRVSAFLNKEREVSFEKSSLCLAVAGGDETGDRSEVFDATNCVLLNPSTRCKLFTSADVTEFLKSLLSYTNMSEHMDNFLKRNLARDATSALFTAIVHFPFSDELITNDHINLLGKVLNSITRNWFATRNMWTPSDEWFRSVTNGVISRVLTNFHGIYESYLSEVQKMLEETISNILSCSPSKASVHQLLDNWHSIDSAISFILDAVPIPVQQINEDSCFGFLKFTFDLLSREVFNSHSKLHDLLQSPSFTNNDFDSICCLFVLWGQLSQRMQMFNKSHVTPLQSLEALSSDQRDPQAEAIEGESLVDFKDHSTHVFLATMDPEFPSWSALQSTAKEFGHEKLKSVLKNRLQPPIEREHTEDHADTLASDLNLLHELHRPTNFQSTLSKSLLATLEQSMRQVHLATDPTPLSLTLFDTITRPDDIKDRAAGTRMSLLLQTPVFCTAAHGPLFNAAGISLVDDAFVSSDASTTATSTTSVGADQPISSNFTVQSATSAWMGASGTGAGLPNPNIIASSSVQEFVSLTVSSLLPALLTLLEADKRNWHLYTATPNTESDHDESCLHESHVHSPEKAAHLSTTPTNLKKPLIDLSPHYGRHPAVTHHQISFASSSMDEDSFYSTVAPILNALVQFLSGQSFPLRTQHTPDSGFGILAQITEVVLSTDEQDLVGQERVALCIADCLILRSLCHLISVLFRSHFKLSTAAVTDTSLLSNTDLSSQFAEFAKQYDSAIRILSEHMTDLAAIYGNNLIVEHNLPTTDFSLKLPSVECCSSNVRALHGFLRRLWHSLGRTCPAGLARQLMAHVGGQCLGLFVQLFATDEYTVQVDSDIARNDAWIALKTAEFCLFTSSETVADLVGLSQQNTDLNLIHSTATLLAQILLCRHTPEVIWTNIHDGGFYKRVLTEEKPFDFSVSNWLHLSNKELFPELPFVLMREGRQQIELEVEWELFAASRHFDPIRLLSMICSSEARLSSALLSCDAFSAPSNDNRETDGMVRVMAALFCVCALVPGLEMFHTGVVTSYLSTDPLVALPAIDPLSPTDDKCPVWLHAILLTLEEPLNRVWSRFRQLVEWHICQDEAFSPKTISASSTNQDAASILAHHQPQTRTFWTSLVSNTVLPCGCALPKPPKLGPELPVHCFAEARQVHPPNKDRTCAGRTTLNQAVIERRHEEHHRGSYMPYLLCGGQQSQAWRELACDLMHLGVTSVPVGLQLALATIDDELEPGQPSTGLCRGGLMWLHIVLLSLSMRIKQEFPEDRVRIAQHAVLLEHLASLLESEQDEEIAECKNRLRNHLENLKTSQWSYPEYVGHSSAGRTFRLAQLVRLVQQHALPELYFLHAFFKYNIPWIRAVIRGLRTKSPSSFGVDSAVQPLFDFVKNGQLNVCSDNEPVIEMSEIEHIDWDRISKINFGLVESTMHSLRPQPDQFADLPKTNCITIKSVVA